MVSGALLEIITRCMRKVQGLVGVEVKVLVEGLPTKFYRATPT